MEYRVEYKTNMGENLNTSQLIMTLSSPDVLVETETLLYPWTSLVAEFGGILSLFLGVSIISMWNSVEDLGKMFTTIFKEVF